MSIHRFSPAEHDVFSQIRASLRFPPDEPEMCVIHGNAQKIAAVLDESYGGIGVVIEMADAEEVQVGDPLTVLYYGFPIRGNVQWVQRNQGIHKVRLGIRWSS
jgi:hypothetical protein